MPNIVENTVTMTGTPERIAQVIEAVKSDTRAVDFERIIPIPPHIFRGNLGSADEERHGKNNCWYEWCIFNWGTKWNAMETKAEGNTLYFETAWCVPDSILRALSHRFPDIDFHVAYGGEHEPGETLYRGGLIVKEGE